MNKPVLRNALKKLRAVPFDRDEYANVIIAPQEMLDFLAMVAGIKPVYLLGRGLDDPQWTDGVLTIARSMKLYVIEGPYWDAQPGPGELPLWFHELRKADEKLTAFYLCRAKGIADAVSTASENPPIAMEEEARLLGYPPGVGKDLTKTRPLISIGANGVATR